jgi:hypothetical protein
MRQALAATAEFGRPASAEMQLRPLYVWHERGEPAEPTDEEKADAIQYLREQLGLLDWAEPWWPVTEGYRIAERCFAAGAAA